MISNTKIALLMQLILASKESLAVLEQSIKVGDEKKVEEIKKNLTKLNKSIQKTISQAR